MFTHWSGTRLGGLQPLETLSASYGGLNVVREGYSTGAIEVVTSETSPYSDRVVKITGSSNPGSANVLRLEVGTRTSNLAVQVVLTMPTLAAGDYIHALRMPIVSDEWSGLIVALTQDGKIELMSSWAFPFRTATRTLPAAGTRIRISLSGTIRAGNVDWSLNAVSYTHLRAHET